MINDIKYGVINKLKVPKMMKKRKILHTEYGSFNDDVMKFLIKRLRQNKNCTLLDPMAGTAPLIPYVEQMGHTAYFNDLMPLHYFINKAKVFDVYKNYHKYGKKWYQTELEKCMEPLKNKKGVISNEIIDSEILYELKKAWRSIDEYEELNSTFLRALLLLCVRPFSSAIVSKNLTWVKTGGGISSIKKLSEIINDSINRFDNYYKKYYNLESFLNNGKCFILKQNVSELNIKEKIDLILTSPWYPNRLDPIAMYRPETIFLSSLGYCFSEYSQVSTPRVKAYKDLDSDYDFLTANSKTAQYILSKIKNMTRKKDSGYYLKYFTRYFSILFKIIKKTLEFLSSTGKMYIIFQDNIHRGILIESDRVLRELLNSYGWKTIVVKKFERHHLGLRNVSREYAFVKPKHYEKIMLIKK